MSAIRGGRLAARAVATAEAEPSDTFLVAASASGDRSAFESLYRRHADAAWRVASAVASNRDDAADAVSDAFTRVLAALEAGRLDDPSRFRSYLLSATRNAAIDLHRRSGRLRPTERMDDFDAPANARTATERVDDRQDATLVAKAFRGLPERWRSVLWLVEVEGIPPREAADLLGLSANNVSQLAVRARVGLRERFVQAHLGQSFDDGCRFCVERLGSYVVGTLSPRDLAKVDQHLAACADCRERAAQLEDLGGSLRRIVLPLPFLLAPAAMAKWQLTSASGAASIPAPSAPPGASTPGSLASRAQRPLIAASTGLFALGVISASVVGPAGGLRDRLFPPRVPVAITAAAPLQVVELAASNGASSLDVLGSSGLPPDPATAADALAADPSPRRTPAADDPAQRSSDGPKTATTPTADPAPSNAPTPTRPEPLANLGVGASIVGTSTGLSVGTGDGSCTGGAVGPLSSGCPPPAAGSSAVGATIVTDGSVAGGVLNDRTIFVGL